jgi:hypothetical protein
MSRTTRTPSIEVFLVSARAQLLMETLTIGIGDASENEHEDDTVQQKQRM